MLLAHSIRRLAKLMPTGTVKFFNSAKGYGFISPEGGGNDVFVHVSELERSGIHSLTDGDRVSFDTKMDPKKGKPNAVNVRKT
jgi:CspA family cold shock protein